MKSKAKYIPALRFNFLTKWFDFFLVTTFPEKKIKKALIDQCGFYPNVRLKALDFGCGTLTLSIMAKNSYPLLDVTGVDIDPGIIKIASQKLVKEPFHIKLDTYDGGRLAYSDAEFNIVYSSLVFHHIMDENKLSSFKEIQRVLIPGGRFCMADFGKPKGLLRKIAFAMFRRFDGEKNTRANAKGLLPELIQEAGFVHVRETMTVNTVFGTIVLIDAFKKSV